MTRSCLLLEGTRHGSITARINDKSQYEVTTLRIDKKTDGRHAEVEFVRDWAIGSSFHLVLCLLLTYSWSADASRRDLTINAMFLDFEGNVIDYFNGREDLERKLIRFVGDPGERVREDYLRIFRYFRFYVRYGCLTQHEEKTIEAIRSNSNGLNQISGERIWAELKRLLKLKDAPSVMHLMLNDLRIGMYMGFMSHPIDVKEYERVHEALFNETPVPLFEPVTALTALMRNEDDLNQCAKRLKFSNNERFASVYILANRDERNRVSLKSLQKQLALIPPTEQESSRKYVLEFLRYINQYELLKEMRDWPVPKFTIDTDLMKERMKNRSGREYGNVMKSLRSAWADNDFSLSEETAKQIIDHVLQS